MWKFIILSFLSSCVFGCLAVDLLSCTNTQPIITSGYYDGNPFYSDFCAEYPYIGYTLNTYTTGEWTFIIGCWTQMPVEINQTYCKDKDIYNSEANLEDELRVGMGSAYHFVFSWGSLNVPEYVASKVISSIDKPGGSNIAKKAKKLLNSYYSGHDCYIFDKLNTVSSLSVSSSNGVHAIGRKCLESGYPYFIWNSGTTSSATCLNYNDYRIYANDCVESGLSGTGTWEIYSAFDSFKFYIRNKTNSYEYEYKFDMKTQTLSETKVPDTDARYNNDFLGEDFMTVLLTDSDEKKLISKRETPLEKFDYIKCGTGVSVCTGTYVQTTNIQHELSISIGSEAKAGIIFAEASVNVQLGYKHTWSNSKQIRLNYQEEMTGYDETNIYFDKIKSENTYKTHYNVVIDGKVLFQDYNSETAHSFHSLASGNRFKCPAIEKIYETFYTIRTDKILFSKK